MFDDDYEEERQIEIDEDNEEFENYRNYCDAMDIYDNEFYQKDEY